ncbi:transglutaminase-like domain-containing protein [Candidatus Entotheonella palauensis]|nr:transglutaminase-like domain-containing protein [Candidatus Entotheonella palauensis]
MVWLFVYPVAAAAQIQAHRSSPAAVRTSGEDELADLLNTLETQFAKMEARLAQDQDSEAEVSELRTLRKRLTQRHQRARKQFARIEQRLKNKGLPDEMMQRHEEAVTTYNAEMKTLLDNLDAIEAAPTPAARQARCRQALEHLRAKHKRQPRPALDPNRLPFRVPDGNVRTPKVTRQAFETWLHLSEPIRVAAAEVPAGLLAAKRVRPAPIPEELAESEAVQITDAIRTLAAQLNHSPVEIYNWVRNHIEFMPTYGSIQGAQMTLDNRKGNALDTASLLIALLRASEIPARYALGTVEIPIAQVMNWVGGVTVPEAALEVLGQGGIPSTALVKGGAIRAVQIEHAWV